MKILKNILNKLSILSLALLTVALILVFALGLKLTNPDTIKGWLAETDTYSQLVKEPFDFVETNTGDSISDIIAQNDELSGVSINNSISEVIAAEYLKEQTENAIDVLYSWLKAEDNRPDFVIGVIGLQNELAEVLADELKTQLNELEKCPDKQTRSLNILRQECLQPGYSVDKEVDEFVERLVYGRNGVQTLTIKDEDLSGDQLEYGQKAYQSIKNGPFVLIILSVLSFVVIIFTASDRVRGLKQAGRTIVAMSILVGTTTAISLLLANWAPSIISSEGSQTVDRAVENIIKPVSLAATEDVLTMVLILSGFALLGGIILLFIASRLDKYEPRHKKSSDKKKPKSSSKNILSEEDKTSITDYVESISTQDVAKKKAKSKSKSKTKSKSKPKKKKLVQ